MISVIFTRELAEMVLDHIGHENCHKCGVVLNGENLAGITQGGSFCKNIICQFALSDEVKHEEALPQ